MLGILEMPSEEELLANRSFFLDQTRRTASPEVTGAPRTRAIPRDASDDARRRRRFLTSSRKRPTRRRRREAKQKKWRRTNAVPSVGDARQPQNERPIR